MKPKNQTEKKTAAGPSEGQKPKDQGGQVVYERSIAIESERQYRGFLNSIRNAGETEMEKALRAR